MTCCGSKFQSLGTCWVKKDILSFVLNVPAINFSQQQVAAILGLNTKRKNWLGFSTYSQHWIPQSSFFAFFFFPNALFPEITNTGGKKLFSSMIDAEQNFQLNTRQWSPGFDIMPLPLFRSLTPLSLGMHKAFQPDQLPHPMFLKHHLCAQLIPGAAALYLFTSKYPLKRKGFFTLPSKMFGKSDDPIQIFNVTLIAGDDRVF